MHLLEIWRGQAQLEVSDLKRSTAAGPVALTGQGEQGIPGIFMRLEEGPRRG